MSAHRGRYRGFCDSAIINGLSWRGARMRNCALRDFRIQARQEKGESKTRESKGGKDKQRVSELNSRQKEGRPPERKARHMEHSDRGAYLAARGAKRSLRRPSGRVENLAWAMLHIKRSLLSPSPTPIASLFWPPRPVSVYSSGVYHSQGSGAARARIPAIIISIPS